MQHGKGRVKSARLPLPRAPNPGITPRGDKDMIASAPQAVSSAPVVRDMKVVPVAGRDGMLLNLSGAHGPFFARNLVILTDNAGHTGLGEVPGGESIRA